jgi:hypothetical protein
LFSLQGSVGELKLYVNEEMTTKLGGAVLMFVGRELYLLLIEVLHFSHG